MAAILMGYAADILQAAQHCGAQGAFLGGGEGGLLTFPIALIFDEFSRQMQEALSSTAHSSPTQQETIVG
jgi:hypothetical protein